MSASSMNIEVRPVSSRRELSTFIKLPWRLYRDEPNWVAPLLMELKKRLDQSKNPFFEQRVPGQRVGAVWLV